jgi:tight adherence protein B
MLVLYLFIFVTVTGGMMSGLQLLVPLVFPDEERLRRRIQDEFRESPNLPVPTSSVFLNIDQLSLDRAMGQISDREIEEITSATRVKTGWLSGLRRLLLQAEVNWTVQHFLFLSAVAALVLAAPGTYFMGPVAGVPVALAGAAVPYWFMQRRRSARREKLIAQLPGAFELMARVLRGGNSVPQALQAVADAFENPVAGEFARCLQQQNLGLRPEVVFQEMAQRTDILEIRIFVMALMIQRQAGGKLSEVLERLGTLIRARIKLRRQVQALTAEGRLQGRTLVVLPFIVFAAMLFINRPYALALLEHVTLLVATGIAMLVGVLWIRRIVNFDY